MRPLTAIKRYFETEPHARPLRAPEIKELSREDRMELGRLACEELGEPFEDPQEAA